MQQIILMKSHYALTEVSLSDESILNATETAESLCNAYISSPMTYQIKNTRVSKLKESSKQKLRQKLFRMQKRLEQRFAEAMAPGQSEEFIQNVLHSNDEEVDVSTRGSSNTIENVQRQ